MKTQKILTALLMIATLSVVSCSKKKENQNTTPVVEGKDTGDAGKDTAADTGGDTGGDSGGDGEAGGAYIEIGGASSPHSEIFKLMQENPGAGNLDMVAKILPVVDKEFAEFDSKEFVVVVANVDGEGATKLGNYSGFETRHVNLSNKAGKASINKLEGKAPESLQIGEVKIEMVVNADGVITPKEPNDLEYNAQMPIVYSVGEGAVAKANLPIVKVSDPATVIELKVEGGNEDVGVEATDATEGQKDVCSLAQLTKDAEGKVSGILINNIVDITNASLAFSKLTPDDLAKLPQDADIKLDIVCFALVKNKLPTILITTSPIILKIVKSAGEREATEGEGETAGDDAGKEEGDDAGEAAEGDDAGTGTSGPEGITPNGGTTTGTTTQGGAVDGTTTLTTTGTGQTGGTADGSATTTTETDAQKEAREKAEKEAKEKADKEKLEKEAKKAEEARKAEEDKKTEDARKAKEAADAEKARKQKEARDKRDAGRTDGSDQQRKEGTGTPGSKRPPARNAPVNNNNGW